MNKLKSSKIVTCVCLKGEINLKPWYLINEYNSFSWFVLKVWIHSLFPSLSLIEGTGSLIFKWKYKILNVGRGSIKKTRANILLVYEGVVRITSIGISPQCWWSYGTCSRKLLEYPGMRVFINQYLYIVRICEKVTWHAFSKCYCVSIFL